LNPSTVYKMPLVAPISPFLSPYLARKGPYSQYFISTLLIRSRLAWNRQRYQRREQNQPYVPHGFLLDVQTHDSSILGRCRTRLEHARQEARNASGVRRCDSSGQDANGDAGFHSSRSRLGRGLGTTVGVDRPFIADYQD
jgi:hypothetical protein